MARIRDIHDIVPEPGGSEWEKNVERWQKTGVDESEFSVLLADLVTTNKALRVAGERPMIDYHLLDVLKSDQKDRVWQALTNVGFAKSAEPNLVDLRMRALGLSELLNQIRRAEPISVSTRYVELVLHDFGSESLIFRGKDQDTDVLVVAKTSFSNFGDPAHLDIRALRRCRQRLAVEAANLARLRGTSLPDIRDMVVAPSPLLPRSFPDDVRRETFVIMEYIPGTRVDRAVLAARRLGRTCCVERVTTDCTLAYLRLQVAVQEAMGNEFYYTDIKPENAIVSAIERVRIVDASGIADVSGFGVGGKVHISPLYLSSADYAKWLTGRLSVDERFVLRSLARMVSVLFSNGTATVGKDLLPAQPDDAFARLMSVLNAPELTLQGGVDLVARLAESLHCEHSSAST